MAGRRRTSTRDPAQLRDTPLSEEERALALRLRRIKDPDKLARMVPAWARSPAFPKPFHFEAGRPPVYPRGLFTNINAPQEFKFPDPNREWTTAEYTEEFRSLNNLKKNPAKLESYNFLYPGWDDPETGAGMPKGNGEYLPSGIPVEILKRVKIGRGKNRITRYFVRTAAPEGYGKYSKQVFFGWLNPDDVSEKKNPISRGNSVRERLIKLVRDEEYDIFTAAEMVDQVMKEFRQSGKKKQRYTIGKLSFALADK